jgi:hypothetical protein
VWQQRELDSGSWVGTCRRSIMRALARRRADRDPVLTHGCDALEMRSKCAKATMRRRIRATSCTPVARAARGVL